MVKILERKFAMNLQFFAEPEENGGSVEPDNTNNSSNEATSEETHDDSTEPKQEGKDLNSVIEKLQKRLNSKTQAEKETKDQLAHALERIEQLEKKQKGLKVREGKEDAKTNNEQTLLDERDKEIADLKRQIKRSESRIQADEVLKEAGLSVGRDLLDTLVSDEDEQTLANVKALVNFVNELQKAWELKRNSGTAPKKTPGGTKTVTAEEFSKMTYAQRVTLAKENKELFKKLTGGI